jgi:hypothetical protein
MRYSPFFPPLSLSLSVFLSRVPGAFKPPTNFGEIFTSLREKAEESLQREEEEDVTDDDEHRSIFIIIFFEGTP